jgi:hypothetical protein
MFHLKRYVLGVTALWITEPEKYTHLRKDVKVKRNTPLERDIESKVCEYAKSKGVLVYKFTSPARAAVPDRMFVRPDGVIFFIEFKRGGQKPTQAQDREHNRLRGHKVNVFVVDNVDSGKMVIDMMVGSC